MISPVSPRKADQEIGDDRLEIVAAVNGVAAGVEDDAGRDQLIDQLQRPRFQTRPNNWRTGSNRASRSLIPRLRFRR